MNTLPAHNYKALNDIITEKLKAQQAELDGLSRMGSYYNKIVDHLSRHPIQEDHKLSVYSSFISLYITGTPFSTFAAFDRLTSNIAKLFGRDDPPNISCCSWDPKISREFYIYDKEIMLFRLCTSMIVPKEGFSDLKITGVDRQVTTTEYRYEIYTTTTITA